MLCSAYALPSLPNSSWKKLHEVHAQLLEKQRLRRSGPPGRSSSRWAARRTAGLGRLWVGRLLWSAHCGEDRCRACRRQRLAWHELEIPPSLARLGGLAVTDTTAGRPASLGPAGTARGGANVTSCWKRRGHAGAAGGTVTATASAAAAAAANAGAADPASGGAAAAAIAATGSGGTTGGAGIAAGSGETVTAVTTVGSTGTAAMSGAWGLVHALLPLVCIQECMPAAPRGARCWQPALTARWMPVSAAGCVWPCHAAEVCASCGACPFVCRSAPVDERKVDNAVFVTEYDNPAGQPKAPLPPLAPVPAPGSLAAPSAAAAALPPLAPVPAPGSAPAGPVLGPGLAAAAAEALPDGPQLPNVPGWQA